METHHNVVELQVVEHVAGVVDLLQNGQQLHAEVVDAHLAHHVVLVAKVLREVLAESGHDYVLAKQPHFFDLLESNLVVVRFH